MRKKLGALMLARREELKTEWDRRLRSIPPSTALALPEILCHRMHETLDELDSLMGRPYGRQWLANNPPQMAGLSELCRCGLNPLLDYFGTGALALATVLRDLDDADKRRLDQAWHLMAQREIESLCAACCRVCPPELQFPPLTKTYIGRRPPSA